ncbi:MAG: helix-turn-helix domain-containing protein [Bacteroidetes bacterium]|nr:helix-turn-helix domain-containing protein [Bacteroidota bacterium]MBU1114482.1 helix-turn-helix domain-containing protein [Bacteroidota bacterium]MBU1799918.1 helix-turn-helix domain-containing protein [Bacteroidota bacterium]
MHKREEIKHRLNSLGITNQWLAEKLQIKQLQLSYFLENDLTFDDDLYNAITEAIESYQFEFGFDFSSNDPDLFDEEKLKNGIGERIRTFAKRKYNTLKGLANALDISPQQLQQYITNNREPGSKILIRFMRAGCDINWLLGGSESIETYKIYKLESELKELNSKFSKISHIINTHK